MTTFYIYEIPGEKNGATNNWAKRSQYNFGKYGIYPILIETIEGPNTPEFWQIVGDREWELADQNGYDRGTHYRVARENRPVWDTETASDAGKIGGPIRGLQLKDGLQSSEVWANYTQNEKQQRCDNISKGIKKSDKHKAALYQLQKDKCKFTWDIAEKIRGTYSKGGWSHKTLAKEYNCSAYAISCILSYKTYTTPKWKA